MAPAVCPAAFFRVRPQDPALRVFYREMPLAPAGPGCARCCYRRSLDPREIRRTAAFVPPRQIKEIVTAGDTDDGACFLRLENALPSHPFIVRLPGPVPISPRDCPDSRSTSRRFRRGLTLTGHEKGTAARKDLPGGTPLEECVLGEIRYGIAVEPAFVISAAQRKELVSTDPRCKTLVRPYIPGGEIGRYRISFPRKFCIFIPQGSSRMVSRISRPGVAVAQERHPGVARHLQAHEEDLKARPSQGDYWWEIACDPDAGSQEKDRIIFTARKFPPRFTLGSGRTVFDCGTAIIPSGSPSLLGILNSRLATFVLRSFVEETSTAAYSSAGEILGRPRSSPRILTIRTMRPGPVVWFRS